MMNQRRPMRALKFLLFVPLFLAVFALLGWIVMSLWNWLLPALFGFKLITYWQAFGLIILSRLLFGGFRGPRGGGGRWRGRMRGRWEQMTPEEREQFRQKMRACWSEPEPGPAETKPTA